MQNSRPGITCPLCSSAAELFLEIPPRKYFKCSKCLSVFLDPLNYLTPEKEKARYDKHQNDSNDQGYQEFTAPLIQELESGTQPGDRGLDFGAGPGAVIAGLLRKKGYSLELYDPYYWPQTEPLQSKYDYIICSEAMEHFREPHKEFLLMKSLLKPGGSLYCTTHIYSEAIDFKQWYYKNDPTHVFFYHENALNWIRDELGFAKLRINNRVLKYTAYLIT